MKQSVKLLQIKLITVAVVMVQKTVVVILVKKLEKLTGSNITLI